MRTSETLGQIAPALVKALMEPHVYEEANTGCLLWGHSFGSGGYGVLTIKGVVNKAHRWAWYAEYGEMPPPETKVCHKCDTPACVQIGHLFLGSQAENVADMMAKGRHRSVPKFGSQNPRAALNETKVWEIRRCAEMDRWSQAEIARSYGVSPMTVSRIVNFESWPHVTRDWPAKPVPHTHGNVWYG